jgi:hypothetical protein
MITPLSSRNIKIKKHLKFNSLISEQKKINNFMSNPNSKNNSIESNSLFDNLNESPFKQRLKRFISFSNKINKNNFPNINLYLSKDNSLTNISNEKNNKIKIITKPKKLLVIGKYTKFDLKLLKKKQNLQINNLSGILSIIQEKKPIFFQNEFLQEKINNFYKNKKKKLFEKRIQKSKSLDNYLKFYSLNSTFNKN